MAAGRASGMPRPDRRFNRVHSCGPHSYEDLCWQGLGAVDQDDLQHLRAAETTVPRALKGDHGDADRTSRREQDKHVSNAMLEACPARQLLSVLSDKWMSLILTALTAGPKRHSELRRDIGGASQKMLTQTLRGLERDGLVARTVTASVPVRVDYELTALGHDLARS